jgi:hypothetical protein
MVSVKIQGLGVAFEGLSNGDRSDVTYLESFGFALLYRPSTAPIDADIARHSLACRPSFLGQRLLS